MSVWNLSAIQHWMQGVIQHPAGVSAFATEADQAASAGPTLQVILPSSRQSSAERLQIYAHAYFARLLEVLQGEFPTVTQAMGPDLFAQFALGYLHANPSRSDTLGQLGAHFPAHLAATRPPRETAQPDWADFLIDCSRLERVYAEVFDGPGPERRAPFSPDHWLTLPPAEQIEQTLDVPAWVRLIELQFPVHEYMTAVRRGGTAALPEAATTFLVVTRRDFVVRRASVDALEFLVLRALQEGATIRGALETLWSHPRADTITPATIQGWFARWMSAGYVRAKTNPAAIP